MKPALDANGPKLAGKLTALVDAIVARDTSRALRLLADAPALAKKPWGLGDVFHAPIAHHVYGGDTALHVAAAAFDADVARALIAAGADVRAKNRRGAEPLHYASDGRPGDVDAAGQRAMVELLVDAGADPRALDESGVAPIHRAVRTRGVGAVIGLLGRGADPRQANKRGSTPLSLATSTTGKSGAGADAARAAQAQIVEILRRALA